MIAFHNEFDFPNVLKSERILGCNYSTPKIISYVVNKKIFSAWTSSPINAGISTSAASSITGMSSVDPV